jgi:GH35 family endo-1,4-beta-xylanase
MKKLNRLLAIIAGSSLLVSCADEFNSDFKVDKPASIAQYEYLNVYGNLKSYVNRTTDPNFKLGAALAVDDYLKKELVYSLTCANFDEMTAGNEMKHASCVNDKGQMDFAKVTKFVETAKAAGLSVYGHTLCWHAQQNNTYLNSLIAPTVIPGTGGPELHPSVITNSDFETNTDGWGGWGNGSTRERSADGEGYNGTGFAYTMTNPSASNFWSAQTAHDFASVLENGAKYRLHFFVKANTAGTIRAELQSSSDYSSDGFGTFAISTEWKEYTLETTLTKADRNRFLISFGDFAGKVYIDKVTLCKVNPDYSGPSYDPSVITTSDFENGATGWGGWGNSSTRGLSASGEGFGGSGFAYTFTNPSVTNFWSAQTAYDFASLENGAKYKLNFQVKASSAGTIRADLQSSSDYSSDGFGTFAISTEWKEYTMEITVTKADRNRFLFSHGDFAGTVYIDNITLCRLNPNGTGDKIIEKTPEEKKVILSGALETWIKGMMEACKGNVKSWDVVNEPMSDSNPYELKSDPAHTDKANFYWQDYLGKEYARYAVQYARQYGGNDLKLFINDYNLEAAYNNNTKCDGLIKMIQYWESDGVTKIDGIGSQMHVTYNLNPEEQAKQEAAVVKMFQMLAASGKLIKISELDMGIFDNANNVKIKTADVTYDQLVLMSKFYQFIIDKYFELIPASQRYGITQWCITDSPEKSGWRDGEPVGLWTLDYNRKPCYEGFVNGLK